MNSSTTSRRRFAAIVALFAALAAPPLVYGDGYPSAESPVNDYAGLLTAEQEEEAAALLAELAGTAGVEAVVVTVASIAEYGTGDRTVESFATHLFNARGIGDGERNDGVLILVAVADRAVRIEVGSGYGATLDGRMSSIVEARMVPAFRRDDYGGGVLSGLAAVVALLGQKSPEDPLQAVSPPPGPTRLEWHPPPKRGPSLFAVLMTGFMALGTTLLGRRYVRRFWPRRCSKCRTRLICLDEVADDQHLSAGQQLEESLGSINYDVWRCPSCGQEAVENRRRFSPYTSCPQCEHHTLAPKFKWLNKPTFEAEGKLLLTKSCQHCQHEEQQTLTVRLGRSSGSSSARSFSGGDDSSWSGGGGSSSSGGSSSGGGSSAGRGASGRW